MAQYARRPVYRRRLRGLGYTDTRSVGASIWEFLHPGTVQREFEAVGKSVPGYGEIWESAADDAITAARETAGNVAESAQAAAAGAMSVARYALIGAGIYLALQLLGQKRRKK